MISERFQLTISILEDFTMASNRTAFSSGLVEFAKLVRLFETKQSDAANVGNWITQVCGNDHLKNRVEISAEFVGKKVAFFIENWQPARILSKGLWENVVDGNPSDLVGFYERGEFPAEIEANETLALIAYLVGLNIFGKPLSAVSGGRALAVVKLLDTIKPKALSLTIKDISVGGNKKDKFSVTLNLDDIRKIAEGGCWRGNLVLALPSGKRTSSVNNSILDGWEVK
jgi:hypothetical protein